MGVRTVAKVVILGAGVMGSAMAVVTGDREHDVALVGTPLDEAIIHSVKETKLHPKLGITLPPVVAAYRWDRFGYALEGGVDLLILGVSSAGLEWAIDQLVQVVEDPLPVLMITKGLVPRETSIEVLPTVVARELELRKGLKIPVMAVGGPCIAGELAAKHDTSVMITGEDGDILDRVADMLNTPYYHARTSKDVIGIEFCAAFKNLHAIGVGWARGRFERVGRGVNGAEMHNLAAGLFSQALAELSVLVRFLGGDQASVAGLAGAGDLYVTCQAGRNYRLGRLLGLGMTYSRAKADHMAADTIEGADLALTIGPALDAMIMAGALPGQHLPLTRAIIDAICQDKPFEPPFWNFFRT
jgi:glycerol-3-phosphate dehydrogenase (NAD(P)+)